ncbi:MAG: DUF4170 domain-containing protein [Alphaproteobacteria bacterium]|nr:DUF4170 domain-containing protein [Pseudomonadota bacterium]MDA1060015.1 DUF4170 domain-containing protein [Pseudomonadota bacterium]NQV81574.1 DUF4170 domain-containing protein [Alphaproteobacteria bacterium]
MSVLPTSKPATTDSAEQPLFLVYGGRVEDPSGERFVDLPSLDIRGIFDSDAAAYDAWRGASQQHVDDAFIKYVIQRLR